MEILSPSTLAHRTVGNLVAEDYRRAAVFKRMGIDFCCGGGQTLEAVCRKKGLTLEAVADALESADTHGAAPQARVNAWAPGFLADFIVNEHHAYVRESIPVLRAFTQKVARVHGGNHPELVEIAGAFEQVAVAMEEHMQSEEEEVFPLIKEYEATRSGKETPARSLRALIGQMEGEHDEAGALMQRIRTLSADYTPPPDACNTYRASFAKLEEFEEDLHRHVHLENNVLFPKALAFEDEGQQGAEEAPSEGASRPTTKVLDVRIIPPPQKHPTVFAAFDALEAGDHFMLVNDHDPFPLRYQFEHVRPQQVGWEYVEQGPERWQVRITKLARGAA